MSNRNTSRSLYRPLGGRRAHKYRTPIVVFIGFAVLIAVKALAQTAASTETGANTGPEQIAVQEVPKVEIEARVPLTTEVPGQTPVTVDLDLMDLPGAPADLDVKNAILKGYVRKVEHLGKTWGQLVLAGVEKNGNIAALEQEDFVLQWEMKTDDLGQGEKLVIPGDGPELIKALQSLQEEPEETAKETDSGQQPVVEASSSESGSRPDGANEQLAFSSPEPLPAQVEEEPLIDVRVTEEGCSIRLDFAQGFAVQQSKTQTFENGTLTSADECSDSNDRFALERSYSACSDLVDVGNLRATAQFEFFYTDKNGGRVIASACQPDDDRTFAIVENHVNCTERVDLGAGVVTPQASLVYTGSSGAETEVRGCQTSTSRSAVALVETTEGCSPRHNATTGQSAEQTRLIYTLEGKTFQATECADSGSFEELAKDFGSCPDVVDIPGRTAFAQFIYSATNIDGGKTLVGGCTRDDSASFSITEKLDGCAEVVDLTRNEARLQASLVYTNLQGAEVPVRGCADSEDNAAIGLVETIEGCGIVHDLASGQSNQHSRLVYTLNGQTKQAAECSASTATFAHQQLFEVDGSPLCNVFDRGDDTYSRQYRMAITVASTRQFVTECTPDNVIRQDVEIAEGCEIRHDFVREVAIQQTKKQHIEDGVVAEESGCSDSSEQFVMKRSYVSCSDVVNLPARFANPQFETYFINGKTERIVAAACQIDAEQVLSIVEDHGSCAVAIDTDAMTVTPQSRLTYQNLQNQSIEVQSCQNSASKAAVPLVENTDQCDLRHDFGRGESVQMAMHLFTLDNVVFQASSCFDTDETFAHEALYSNNGTALCNDIIDQGSLSVTRQHRIAIDEGTGFKTFLTDCKPDATSLTITETTAGCENPSDWIHDLNGGVSYGQTRHFYMKDGQQEFITSCDTGSDSFTHQIAVISYQHDDSRMASLPISRVTINAPGFSGFVVEESIILPGQIEQPYIFARTENIAFGAATYEGCIKKGQANVAEFYTRPDATEFSRVIGTELVDFGDICSAILSSGSTEWSTHTYTCSFRVGGGRNGDDRFETQTKGGCINSSAITLMRDDGVPVSTENVSGGGDANSSGCPLSNPSVPTSHSACLSLFGPSPTQLRCDELGGCAAE